MAKKTPITDTQAIQPIHPQLAADAEAVQVIANQTRNAMAVIGYELPYDRERVVQEARFYMAHSAEAFLEAGRRLLVLKENEAHGDFQRLVTETLGLGYRSAANMMQAATVYLLNPDILNVQALAHLGKTKLLELMCEPGEELAALAAGGTLAGASLDDIDRMTSRELKAHLREAREDAAATDKRLTDKSLQIETLKGEVEKAGRRLQRQAPAEVLEQLQAEITHYKLEGLSAIAHGLGQGFEQIDEHCAAEQSVMPMAFLSSALGELSQAIAVIAERWGIEVSFAPEAAPSWMFSGEELKEEVKRQQASDARVQAEAKALRSGKAANSGKTGKTGKA
jgi:hypothetical protein